jgi:hypothetical protein
LIVETSHQQKQKKQAKKSKPNLETASIDFLNINPCLSNRNFEITGIMVRGRESSKTKKKGVYSLFKYIDYIDKLQLLHKLFILIIHIFIC